MNHTIDNIMPGASIHSQPGRAAEATPGTRGHRRTWRSAGRIILCLAAAMAILATVAVGGIAYTYHQKSQQFDLGEVDRLETGCSVVGTDGTELGRLYVEDRRFVKLDEVAPVLIDAIIATEDARFFDHNGFDKKAMVRAAWVNLKAQDIKQGASTITQQLARHVYRLRGKNFDRKLTEIFLARRLEGDYAKNEILEHYLNRIYLGSSYYGVGAAALGYFGKDAGDLTLEEAALIAGIIKGPSSFSPYVSPEEAERVRNHTLERMETLGMIDSAQCKAACTSAVSVQKESQRDKRPYFAMEAVRREIEKRYPATEHLDGAVVSTTIDSNLQHRAIDAIRYHSIRAEQLFPQLRESEETHLDAAAVVIENRSGKIVATVGGRNFKRAPFDHSLSARRPPGTAFLPLTYTAFFSTNHDAVFEPVLDAPHDNKAVMVGGQGGTLAEWGGGPARYLGFIPAARAFLESRTGAAVRTGHEAGLDAVLSHAVRSGIGSSMNPYPSSLLGSSPLKLVELARAYTVFPNGGVVCPEVQLVDFIQLGPSRTKQPYDAASGREVFPPFAAVQAREIMAARLRRPEYAAVLSASGLERLGLAGQPGASYGFADAWFVGFDQHHTCAVWVGFGSDRSLEVKEPGRLLAMPLWAEIMAATGTSQGWPLREEDVTQGKCVCLHSAKVATQHCWEVDRHGVGRMESLLPPYKQIQETCDLHTGSDDQPAKIVPAQLISVPGDAAQPVKAKQPVLLGESPYSL